MARNARQLRAGASAGPPSRSVTPRTGPKPTLDEVIKRVEARREFGYVDVTVRGPLPPASLRGKGDKAAATAKSNKPEKPGAP